ncbi:transcriptional regulator family: Histone-like TF [Trichoderma aggressivum f. europaeum]|uniref:Transcriptional regulator family: Histone-like TF n=1 Tax=Trichoderma aggressivum f. europaeum TaxID=173218 RepID=A0AAE1IA17_9HYPO|nr:transcriptional regulator family: Histone-like TF [Trichoderma aggressivum f. europaeum]
MPYNTNAIPPRKEPTGQTQLPLSRVKKIISQDPDVQMCSNNAAFVITLAAEMFIQHLAEEAHTQAKLERKPRRNIQYKDVANAISHRDNLEFLEDVAPKTVTLKKAKAINQARLRGEPLPDAPPRAATNGAKPKKAAVNGQPKAGTNPFTLSLRGEEREKKDAGDDPSDQLELEMRQAAQPEEDADVDMTG